MSNLPKDWLEVEIGEIANVVGGGTPTASDESNFAEPGTAIAWLTPADLSGYKFKEIAQGKRDLSQKGLKGSSANLMPKNSLLFSSRAPIGYVAIAKNEISTNQGFKSFVFTNHIDSSFAYFYLKSIRPLAESRGTGTTFKELSGAAAKKLPFIIAPLNEQIRIADKLDSVLAKVDTAQARLEKIPTLLKRFRQSVLAAATSGELTREWRDENNLANWEEINLEELIETTANGLSKRSGDTGTDITILRLADFKDARRFYGNERKIKLDEKEVEKYSLKSGDILVIRVNGSVELAGKFIEYHATTDIEGFCDHFIRIRLNNHRILSTYLKFVANEGNGRDFLKSNLSTSAGQNTINQGSVKGLIVPLPTINEQNEIVRRVESLFTLADTVEKQYLAAKQRLDRLSQSLLAKAFRGELLPQDPNDEPAAELLKRIQSERQAQPLSKHKRSKPT